MYVLPSYISRAKISEREIRFIWDDSQTQLAEGETDMNLIESLSALSHRANLTYAIALADWVLGRFASFGHNEQALQYLEACWAVAVDLRYSLVVWEDFPHPRVWGGPVKGSIWLTMLRLQQTIGSLVEDADPEYTASKILQIARHVLPNTQEFDQWNRIILERLGPFLREEGDVLGEMIPREFFDLSVQVGIADFPALVDRYLRSLDYEANAFLNSPTRMFEEGFSAQPYRFSLSVDRQQRGKGTP